MPPTSPSLRSAVAACARVGLLLVVFWGNVSAQEVVVPAIEPHVVIEAPPAIDTAKANKVKAVYLYSFGRFTKWPGKASAPEFTIGIIGESSIFGSLSKIARKRKIHERQIKIARFSGVHDAGISSCEMLFVSRSISDADLASLLTRIRNKAVLTVTESPSRPPGTVVNFVFEGDGIKFEINNQEAQRKKLAMDARLLRQGRKMLVGTQTLGP